MTWEHLQIPAQNQRVPAGSKPRSDLHRKPASEAHFVPASKPIAKQAAKLFEQGRKLEPYDAGWLTELARVYSQLEDSKAQIDVLQKLVRTDADDLDGRKRLARLLAAEGRYAEAEKAAREVMEIDVTDNEGREVLLKALEQQKVKENDS